MTADKQSTTVQQALDILETVIDGSFSDNWEPPAGVRSTVEASAAAIIHRDLERIAAALEKLGDCVKHDSAESALFDVGLRGQP